MLARKHLGGETCLVSARHRNTIAVPLIRQYIARSSGTGNRQQRTLRTLDNRHRRAVQVAHEHRRGNLADRVILGQHGCPVAHLGSQAHAVSWHLPVDDVRVRPVGQQRFGAVGMLLEEAELLSAVRAAHGRSRHLYRGARHRGLRVR